MSCGRKGTTAMLAGNVERRSFAGLHVNVEVECGLLRIVSGDGVIQENRAQSGQLAS
jgi:hypothetical protein